MASSHHRIVLLFAIAIAIALALGAPNASAQAVCTAFDPGVVLGTVDSPDLSEVSGIAASRRYPDVLWAHDDSGDSARVFAVGMDGTHRGVFALTGATNVDWEDMAIGPGPIAGQDYLYVADTGNNSLNRSVVTVYRVAEPALDTFPPGVQTSIGGVTAFPMQYPGGTRRDAETLLVDPQTGDWLILTRDRSRTGSTYVYLYPAPQQAGLTVTLQLVATLSSSIEIKGGDVSPSGDRVLLRTHSTTQAASGPLWFRAPGTDIESVFGTTPCAAPFVFEPQGEAVAFAHDGVGYYTLGEGANQPIYFHAPSSPPAAPFGVTATALSSSQVRIAWTDAAGNETGYRVDRSTDGTTFTQLVALGAGATQYTNSGLTAGTNYWYRVSAYNDAGIATSSAVAVATPAAPTTPTAPVNLTATATSSSQITLRWTDTATNESGFRIERSTNGFTYTQIGTVGANVTSMTSSGLLPNRTYFYRVRAYNAAGNSAYSNVSSARTRR